MLVITNERFFDLIMLQQNPGVSGVLGRDKIDISQNFVRAQGDVAKVSDWRSNDVKHRGEFDKAKPSNEKRRLYRRDYYENTHLDVGLSTVRNDRLRRRNAAAGYDDDYDDHARGDHGSSVECGCDTRGCGATGAAVGSN